MKTKELIKTFQELDPSGEIEVVVNGDPIYFAEKIPAYYDGALKILIQDESLSPYYNVVGMKITQKGEKIRLNTNSFEDIISENNIEDLTFDFSELSSVSKNILK